MVLREVELLKEGQVAQTGDLANLVLRQVQVFQAEPIQVLDLGDLIHAERKGCQALVARQTLNLFNLVTLEVKFLQLG